MQFLERAGFELLPGRGKGSHMMMVHRERGVAVTVPDHRELDRGTLRAVIRQAGLTREDLERLIGNQ